MNENDLLPDADQFALNNIEYIAKWIESLNEQDCRAKAHLLRTSVKGLTRTPPQWRVIRSAEDLPKETGRYLWAYSDNPSIYATQLFKITKKDITNQFYLNTYIAWQKIEPYQPQGGGENES